MGSGIFYLKSANTVKNVKKNGYLRSFLFAGILLFGMPFWAKAQPTFVNGSPQTLQACMNAPAGDISALFTISDPNAGSGETWSLVVGSGPAFGTVSGFSTFGISTGGTLPTSGITYQPNAGFTGLDQFTVQVTDGTTTSTTVINIVVTPLPSLNVDAIPAVCAGATSTTLSYSSLANVGPTTSTFVYTGGAQTWAVPPGVLSVDFDVQGGVGGQDNHSPAGTANPGNGGRVQGTLNTFGVNALNLYVGGAGANGSSSNAAGGWNGGGNATFYFFGCGGAGGGASDIRIGGNALGNRVVVAGGGGGNGWDSPGPNAGGCGGNLTGGSGANNVGGGHAGGGTQLGAGAGAAYVGWTSGMNGSLGIGGDGSPQGISGGGGGGYYGGGGGVWSGGGGGSSYTNAGLMIGSPTYTQCYNIGNGIIGLNYVIPGTFTVIWDPTAHSAGFTDINAATFVPSPLTLPVPPTAPAATYTGTLTVSNNNCTSTDYPISITINPIPDVATPSNQVMCKGDISAPVIFTGSVAGTAFNWTNDNPSIGLPASGTGPIGSFTATNTTPNPIIATITITPTANGCSGTPVSFTITVNPTPMLTSSLTPPDICDSTIFHYLPTSLTGGTTFTFTVNPTVGIVSSFPGGSGDPGLLPEYLDNTTTSPVAVTFTYLLAANACTNTENVVVNVNPTPMLSTSLTPPAICNNSLFFYPPASSTVGTTFTWNRNIVAGISNPAATGTNNPNEVLHNTTSAPIAVPYTFTLIANGCINTQVVTVTVNPTPTLNSGTTPPAICSGDIFIYGPGSATTGTSFSWSRGAISGIIPATNSGSDSIIEPLTNTTQSTITVTYVYTMIANSCTSTENIMVNVYPTPLLSTATNLAMCDSTILNYPPASLVAGTTFTWTRAVVAGISNLAGAGTGNPNELLHNTTPSDVIVTYVYTLAANGCSHNQNVNVTVHPTPKLNSSLTPGAICDSFVFNYVPTSLTAGATFNWFRPYIPGIYALASSGAGNPNQYLKNSTYVVVDVTYTYTITANGCSNIENVTVKVNPTPKLNPPYTQTVCSGTQFNYVPASYTPGALYAWNRPQVSNITPLTNFTTIGNGEIHETLWNGTLAPATVDYIYRLTINGCTNLGTQTLKVTVNPTPNVPNIITTPAYTICSGAMYQEFGTDLPSDQLQYHWSVTNGTVYGVGNNNQYALINFPTPGISVVSLTTNVNGYGCKISNSVTVNVSSSNAIPPPQVVYFNGQLICLRNDNGITYQWGYDDLRTLASTVLTGEINQNYNIANLDPNKHYWVMTNLNDCMQKAYFDDPAGITNLNNDAELKVYPNPANEVVNVEINSSVNGNMQIEVLNLLGQRLDVQTVVNHKASINVANLPNGVYLINCYMDGNKIATSRFIKN